MNLKTKIILATILMLLATATRGATVNLASGVISPMNFQSGNTYIGSGTTIRNTSTAAFSYCANLQNLSNVTLKGIVFDGNPFFIQGGTNITLEDVTIQNARRSANNHQALYFTGTNGLTLRRVKIINCTQAVQSYGGANVLAEDCYFEKDSYGWKWGLAGTKNVVIRRLLIKWDRQMGIEFQTGNAATDNILIEDCAYIEPELYADDSKNGNAMAFSVPMDGLGTNIVGRRNYADGYAWIIDANGNRTGERRASSKSWIGLRDGFEIGGTRPQWYQNWCIRLNDPGAVTTSTGANNHDNRIEACLENWDNASGASGAIYANNGPNVQLPAVGGWTLAGVTAPGTVAPPATPPTPIDNTADLQAQIADLTAQLNVAKNQAVADKAVIDRLTAQTNQMRALVAQMTGVVGQ